TRISGKYLGDHPLRSMYTLGLCTEMASASSCQGKDGWARMIWTPGNPAAPSSPAIGLEYFRRTPPPPGMPAPIPVVPEWNRAINPAEAITSYKGNHAGSL